MIRLEHITKIFNSDSGELSAVKDVSISVKAGEIYGIIGFSGAGKSTLVRCINLLEKPTSGKVFVDGKDLIELSKNSKALRAQRKNIGMIFQLFNLLDRSTVLDNVAYPLKHCGKTKEEIESRALELLELVNLSDKKDSYPCELSGGQKQRVAIARALANNPKVLLSDEATSALDPEATSSILELLKTLNKKLGITIVINKHEMSVIKAVCQRVAVMEEGRIVEEGEVYDIFANPKMPITRKFINSTSSLGKIHNLISEKSSLIAHSGGKLLKLQFEKNSVGDALISDISRRFNVDVSIVLANVEILQDSPLGAVIVVIKGEEKHINEAIEYAKQKNVKVFEFDEKKAEANDGHN